MVFRQKPQRRKFKPMLHDRFFSRLGVYGNHDKVYLYRKP